MLKRVFNLIFLQIFFALLLVTLLMFISNFVVYRNSVSGIYENIAENNKLSVKNLVYSFDECFKEINNMIDKASISILSNNIYESNDTENTNIINEAAVIKNLLEIMGNSNSYIKDIVVFSPGSDHVVTPSGTRDFDDFFSENYFNMQYNADFWRHFSQIKHVLKVIPQSNYVNKSIMASKTNMHLMGVIRSVNVNYGLQRVEVLVLIDVDRLLKLINQQNQASDASFAVFDMDKNLILSIGDDSDFKNFKSIYSTNEEGKTVKNDKFEYYFLKSDYNEYTYVSKLQFSLNNMGSFVKSNQIVLIVTILCAILVCIFISLYLYKPIQGVLKLIGIAEKDGSKSKYINIYNGIQSIQNQNKVLETKMTLVEEDVKRSIFFKMIDDITYYNNLKDQIDMYFKVIFYSKQYVMVLFNLSLEEQSENEKGNFHELNSAEKISGVIQNILLKKLNDSFVFHFEKKQFIALIGLEKEVKRDEVMEIIEQVILELKNTVLGEYEIISAVSRFYSDVLECKSAFKDVKLCMAHRNMRLNTSIIDVEKIDYSNEWFFPADYSERLHISLSSGNGKESVGIVKEILNKNMENNINYMNFISIAIMIFNKIINVMRNQAYEKNEIMEMEQRFFEKANTSENHEEISKYLCSAIEMVAKKVEIQNQSKMSRDFIIQYINMHYNEELYLDNMSEILGTSPKYFSNYFKRAFDVNFVEYLNKVRVSHAKNYLKTTQIPINEIGSMVGYSNSSSFTSTFKKVSGISPSEYRKKYK